MEKRREVIRFFVSEAFPSMKQKDAENDIEAENIGNEEKRGFR